MCDKKSELVIYKDDRFFVLNGQTRDKESTIPRAAYPMLIFPHKNRMMTIVAAEISIKLSAILILRFIKSQVDFIVKKYSFQKSTHDKNLPR